MRMRASREKWYMLVPSARETIVKKSRRHAKVEEQNKTPLEAAVSWCKSHAWREDLNLTPGVHKRKDLGLRTANRIGESTTDRATRAFECFVNIAANRAIRRIKELHHTSLGTDAPLFPEWIVRVSVTEALFLFRLLPLFFRLSSAFFRAVYHRCQKSRFCIEITIKSGAVTSCMIGSWFFDFPTDEIFQSSRKSRQMKIALWLKALHGITRSVRHFIPIVQRCPLAYLVKSE